MRQFSKYLHYNKKSVFILTLVIMFVIILLSKGGRAAGSGSAEASEIQEKYYCSIRIEEDDTLWSLANEYGKQFDKPEVFIEEVKAINQITGDTIYENAYLIVPVYK